MPRLATIYNDSTSIQYLAPRCSFAYLWKLFSVFLILVLPLIICFSTQGFWRKVDTFIEQPRISFTKKCILILSNSNDPSNYLVWSSYPTLNEAEEARTILPVITSQHVDNDRDGINDEIYIKITTRLPDSGFVINTIFYNLEFSAIIDYRTVLEVTSGVARSTEKPYRVSKISSFGDLRLHQKQLLPSFEILDTRRIWTNTDHNASQYEFDNAISENVQVDSQLIEYYPQTILKYNNAQNFTIEYTNAAEYALPVVNNNTDTSANVVELEFSFFVRPQQFFYKTSALELIKWALIQYLVVFAIVRLFFNGLTCFFVKFQVFDTVVCTKKYS